MSRFLTALTVSATFFALGCDRPPDRPVNLVLITVDSLRPDRLSHEGHERPTSPTLDRLAEDGLRFTRAYSPAGWTLPSLASVLTGLHPQQHGATRANRSLPIDVPTLATVLDASGYATHGYLSHVLLQRRFGLHRGFDRYDVSVLKVGHPHAVATAEPLTELALAALETIEEPFFVWLHYFDPHFDYLSHEEWAEFGDEPVDRYDGEIAHTDRQIGRLLDALAASEAGARTLVAFTADHGEEFGEHGGRFHFSLHEEVVRVPLVLHGPGIVRGEDAAVAEQIDLLPTMLAMLGVEAPAGLPGRDLLRPPDSPRPVFFERDRPTNVRQRGVLYGDHKLLLISEPESDDASNPNLLSAPNHIVPGRFFYSLADDPGEQRNLYNPDDPIVQRLELMLAAHLESATGGAPTIQVDPEMRERLRSLGYLTQ